MDPFGLIRASIDSSPVANEAAELARAWFENSHFIGEMGMKLVALEPDRATVEMPF